MKLGFIAGNVAHVLKDADELRAYAAELFKNRKAIAERFRAREARFAPHEATPVIVRALLEGINLRF